MEQLNQFLVNMESIRKMKSKIIQPSDMYKAETYTPTSGMKAAARRALRWKEEGKATGAGTPVGWGRATDIVAGRALSLDTVKPCILSFLVMKLTKKEKTSIIIVIHLMEELCGMHGVETQDSLGLVQL